MPYFEYIARENNVKNKKNQQNATKQNLKENNNYETWLLYKVH